MVLDHLDEYPSTYATCPAIAPKLGVGVESLRVWTRQALVDAAKAPGVTTTEQQRIEDLEREVRDLKEANAILKAASIFFAREPDPRNRRRNDSSSTGWVLQDTRVESVCTVLTERGVKVAPRAYRIWKTALLSECTVTDAYVTNALLGAVGAAEGLYGRGKMTVHLRNQGHEVGKHTVDGCRVTRAWPA